MISVRSFHCPISEHRTDVRSGILIYPLPDADLLLRDRIARELQKIGLAFKPATLQLQIQPVFCLGANQQAFSL